VQPRQRAAHSHHATHHARGPHILCGHTARTRTRGGGAGRGTRAGPAAPWSVTRPGEERPRGCGRGVQEGQPVSPSRAAQNPPHKRTSPRVTLSAQQVPGAQKVPGPSRARHCWVHARGAHGPWRPSSSSAGRRSWGTARGPQGAPSRPPARPLLCLRRGVDAQFYEFVG